MAEDKTAKEYEYRTTQASHTEGYLWQPVLERLTELPTSARMLDLGCGNGAFTGELASRGYKNIVGIDPSESGLAQAKSRWPSIDFQPLSAYDPLRDKLGEFDCVVSLEVVEHLYSPRKFAQNVFEVLKPGGLAVISTPFHGYWKNLSMALSGSLDAHFTALWDHGHIKFWSTKTLTELLTEAGLIDVAFRYAGRRYPLSKTMIAICRRPQAS